jgi:site-specific DNA-methyltransferase (adenine-specific)
MNNALDLSKWDFAPPPAYFEELRRISCNQIIWGGNYHSLGPCKHFIFWHKLDAAPSFASGELALTSYDKPAAYYSSAIEKDKIHPCQKPIRLYSWLLLNYAEKNSRILDTHLGSASSAIAAYYFGCDFVGCEIDPDYYRSACSRFDLLTRQADLCK